VANTKSAEKRNRQSQKRRVRNAAVRSKVRGAVKEAREAFASKDAGKAKDALVAATRTLTKASTKGVLHKRTASRRVSRLAKAANKSAQQ
jgi:small subunit ribosomal protein S20